MNFYNLFWIIPLSIVVSFLVNHLADTLPIIRKISLSPICKKCHYPLKRSEYLLFKTCPHCQTRADTRRIILPIIFIITYVLVFIFPPEFAGFYFSIVIITFLYLIFIIDFEHRLILNPVSIIGALLFAMIGFNLNGWKTSILGGGLGFLLMYTLYLFGILFSKWISKLRGEITEEVALGFGDVNLTAILGLLFGWPRIAVLLFFAILFGGLFSVGYLIVLKIQKRYELFTAIPYAPFLIFSAIIMLYISSPK